MTKYTDDQIKEIAEWAVHLADPIRFANPGQNGWPGDKAADMLRSLLEERKAQDAYSMLKMKLEQISKNCVRWRFFS